MISGSSEPSAYVTTLAPGSVVWHPRLGEGVIFSGPHAFDLDMLCVVAFREDNGSHVRNILVDMAGMVPIELEPARFAEYQAREQEQDALAGEALAGLEALLNGDATLLEGRCWSHAVSKPHWGFHRGPYMYFTDVFAHDGRQWTSMAISRVLALESASMRVALCSVAMALADLGHYSLNDMFTCPASWIDYQDEACGVVISLAEDVTTPVVLSVMTALGERAVASSGGLMDGTYREIDHIRSHFIGFAPDAFRHARLVVRTADATAVVHDALARLSDPISVADSTWEDSEEGLSDYF